MKYSEIENRTDTKDKRINYIDRQPDRRRCRRPLPPRCSHAPAARTPTALTPALSVPCAPCKLSLITSILLRY